MTLRLDVIWHELPQFAWGFGNTVWLCAVSMLLSLLLGGVALLLNILLKVDLRLGLLSLGAIVLATLAAVPVFVAIVALMGLAHFMGSLFSRLHMPRVIGEIALGAVRTHG